MARMASIKTGHTNEFSLTSLQPQTQTVDCQKTILPYLSANFDRKLKLYDTIRYRVIILI